MGEALAAMATSFITQPIESVICVLLTLRAWLHNILCRIFGCRWRVA